jgi:hypothetical protein
MHQSLINNLNHWFLHKIGQDCWISKTRWPVKDKLDREALEGIFGFFQVAYINLWFILLTSSTFYFMLDLLSRTTKLDEPRVLYVCCAASRELRGLME